MRLDLELIENFAKKNNIIARACHAAPLEMCFPETARVWASPFVPFVSRCLANRTDPERSLSGVKSIVIVGVGYEIQTASKTSLKASHMAELSSLGVNKDYHVRVKNLLRELMGELQAQGDFKYKIFVDSPGLNERALAYRAGLGFFGRNGLVISQKFGSRFNIGCLLLDLALPEDEGQKKLPPLLQCPPDCNLCINACPTGALTNKGFQVSYCISYLTQKDELSPKEEKLIGNQLYGCDICQDICLFNEKRQAVCVNPQEWLAMDDEAFKQKYGHTAMFWRGTGILRRNARAVCHNT